MRKLSVDRTKRDVQRGAAFAKGGRKGGMVKPQAAGAARPGSTGKDQTAAPGTKFARGGNEKPFAGGLRNLQKRALLVRADGG